MQVLKLATKAAHQKILNSTNVVPYSRFPVHESEFWEEMFKFAKDVKTAKATLEDISIIESEPCIENDRVWQNVSTVKAYAKLALLN